MDLNWAGSLASAQPIGTLKQAYLSWQPEPSLLLDLGRINARQGVALGYNPTDFFRAGAVRSVVSLDPDSLRENRMGTVMWRGEQLWDSGALTAIFAPRLSGHANSAPLDADLGATNAHARWLLALSQRIAPGWTPQWLAYGAAGQPLQLGMSLTAVLAQSLVAELEFSGGRLRSQWSQALDLPGTAAPRSRAAAGVTYSAVQKLSLSLEYEYDGAGLGHTVAFRHTGMSGVDEAPIRCDRRMAKQPFDRARAGPGEAIRNLLGLFGDMQVKGSTVGQS